MPGPISQLSRPLVFAHRGGAGLAPENTLAAFERGWACGVDGLECDVHLSRDGVPVVIHDPTLDRTTDRRGLVAQCTVAELARADAGFRFRGGWSPMAGAPAVIPTLEAVLRRFPRAQMIVELKKGGEPLARAVVEVLQRTGAAARTCIGSFHQGTLAAVRRLDPDLATSASVSETRWTLYRSYVRWPRSSTAPHVAFQVPERAGAHRVVSPAFIRQAHAEGRVVQVWVVDRADDARRLLEWGVDGLITDRPDVIVPARDAWCASRQR